MSHLSSSDQLGIAEPSYYFYLNQSGTYNVDDIDDRAEFNDTVVSTGGLLNS